MHLPVERLDTFSGDAIVNLKATVALGQIPDAKMIYISGHAPAIPAGSTSVLWALDSAMSATGLLPTVPVNCYLSSSSVSDVGNTIKVTVLDANYDMFEYGVTLNGRNAIVLPIQVRRVLEIENVGSTTTLGDVYAGTEAVPVLGVPAKINTLNMFAIIDQISHTAMYTVPRGYVLLIEEFGGGTPANDSALINAMYSNPGTTVHKVGMHLSVYRGTFAVQASLFPLLEKTDVFLTATAYTNNTEAYGFIFGALLPSHYLRS